MAEERGASPTEGALLISYASAASGIGRLLFGTMADCKRFSKFYIWRTGLLGMSVSSTLVIIARSYEWFVVYAFTFGLFEGCYVTLTPLLVITGLWVSENFLMVSDWLIFRCRLQEVLVHQLLAGFTTVFTATKCHFCIQAL